MKIYMRKLISLLVSCYLIFFAVNGLAGTYLNPGVDGYSEMLNTLGRPLKIETTSDGKNYYYKDVIVNISGSDQSTIMTVSYLKPNVYQKYLNLDVGMTAEAIKWQLDDYYEHKESTYHFITDYRRSLIFWIEKGVVSKMVQARPNSLKRI